jgi:hypothetical protein
MTRGPFEVPLVKNKRLVKPGCPEFWSKPEVDELANQRGCYVFAMRAGRGITPIYVGKATKNFKQECFAVQKIAYHYGPALLEYKRGRPVLFLVVLERTKGKVNKRAIAKVEFFLIQNAMKKNPELSNIKGKREEHWSIGGVIRSGRGKVAAEAKAFKAAMGL